MVPEIIEIPILPLRSSVLFPGAMLPVAIGRPKTLALLKALEETHEIVGLVTQKNEGTDDPSVADLHVVGTTGRIIKALRSGDGFHILLEGERRFELLEVTQSSPYLRGKIRILEDLRDDAVKVEALGLNLRKSAREVFELALEGATTVPPLLESIQEPGRLADLIASALDISVDEKMNVLSTRSLAQRLTLVHEFLQRKLEVLRLSNKINTQVKDELTKAQREHYLRQQLKAIREELGEEEGGESDFEELEAKLRSGALPEVARKAADKELRRLRTITPQSPEYSVARTYLEWIADLPWTMTTADSLDLENARKVLDAKHYGLDKVKKRIIEFLAVRKLKSDIKGPILCLVGPPGVGKTSLAQCIAQAMGRKFQRISLGGVRDEAEIRGHRRTYVGALPGRIIQGLKRAGSNNPVFVLDEVDKLSSSYQGDPSSALLEVLDPEQNWSFSDHYLEVAFDLSKVLFVATANQLDPIPPALKDRMEVIEIPGYTHEEKRHIAERHLIPRVLEAHGLKPDQIRFDREAIDVIITDYTREAGVRNLERSITGVVRAIAVKIAEGETAPTLVTKSDVYEYLGPERFFRDVAERTEIPGVAIGLAWTETGGDILFIEATKMGGKGALTLTGQLGAVMKESVQAAQSYLRSHSEELGVPDVAWEKNDIHVHVPAGSIPKDGPSAGITMAVALCSLMSGVNVRSDMAMTGEITLRGHVLPVGGIKEKVLAAQRAGVNEVILPERNRKDLIEVPEEIRNAMKFHFVSHMNEVLDIALERPLDRRDAQQRRHHPHAAA
jgi:ATP-dependent Lon protease